MAERFPLPEFDPPEQTPAPAMELPELALPGLGDGQAVADPGAAEDLGGAPQAPGAAAGGDQNVAAALAGINGRLDSIDHMLRALVAEVAKAGASGGGAGKGEPARYGE